eukprot:1150752-Pelagomonas_calceolata.AAC.2
MEPNANRLHSFDESGPFCMVMIAAWPLICVAVNGLDLKPCRQIPALALSSHHFCCASPTAMASFFHLDQPQGLFSFTTSKYGFK